MAIVLTAIGCVGEVDPRRPASIDWAEPAGAGGAQVGAPAIVTSPPSPPASPPVTVAPPAAPPVAAGSCSAGAAPMGTPLDGCTDGGAASGPTPARPDGGPDPFSAAAVCTSRTMYTGGEGPRMRPGDACIACHRQDDGPNFAVAGTVYPTAHEPSRCNGVDGTGPARGAEVVVTDSAGRSATASVNAAGNFSISARTLTPPFRAKLVFGGRERVMVSAVPVGDCNLCHTQAGTTTVAGGARAPGRIVLP